MMASSMCALNFNDMQIDLVMTSTQKSKCDKRCYCLLCVSIYINVTPLNHILSCADKLSIGKNIM